MTDLKNRPVDFMPLLALVRCVLGVFHFVAEFKQRIFDIVEARWWRFFVAGCSYGRHFGRLFNSSNF
jgi:hypothetical protein